MLNKMDKSELITILEDWNFWKKDQASGIVRKEYLEKLKALLSSGQVVTITGPRRAGKSFIMRQMAKELLSSGVQKEDVLMVNFEDPRYTELSLNLMEQVFMVYQEFVNPSGAPYLFLDEVQEVLTWEKWVRMMHELRKAKIVVSGSNAKLLSKELGTLLTGRHLDLTVFPLSFSEYLSFNKIDVSDRLSVVSKQPQIKGALRTFLEWGAFPEVVLSGQKKEILLNYFEDIVNKDLLRRFKIRKAQALRALVKFYLSNAATLSTFTSAGKSLSISSDTVEKFSGYLEDVYLVFFLRRFSYKVREQEKSPRKVYSIDTGLSNTVGFRFSENAGRLAENAVFLELKRRQSLNPALELFYWKDEHHREVDFLIKEDTRVRELIQVCWDINNEKTKQRELRSLLKAMDEFDITEAVVITDEAGPTEEIKGKKIKFVPLWKWLLNISPQETEIKL